MKDIHVPNEFAPPKLGMVHLLVRRGALPNKQISELGLSPWCLYLNYRIDNVREPQEFSDDVFQVTELLIQHGADADVQNEPGSFSGGERGRPLSEIFSKAFGPSEGEYLKALLAPKRGPSFGEWLGWV